MSMIMHCWERVWGGLYLEGCHLIEGFLHYEFVHVELIHAWRGLFSEFHGSTLIQCKNVIILSYLVRGSLISGSYLKGKQA